MNVISCLFYMHQLDISKWFHPAQGFSPPSCCKWSALVKAYRIYTERQAKEKKKKKKKEKKFSNVLEILLLPSQCLYCHQPLENVNVST